MVEYRDIRPLNPPLNPPQINKNKHINDMDVIKTTASLEYYP